MKTPYDVLIKPVVSEKSMSLTEENKYTFVIDPRANRTEVKQAVEEVFKVKVEKVNIIRVKGKTIRRQNNVGRTPDIKKAIVKLRSGDSIEIFEGV